MLLLACRRFSNRERIPARRWSERRPLTLSTGSILSEETPEQYAEFIELDEVGGVPPPGCID